MEAKYLIFPQNLRKVMGTGICSLQDYNANEVYYFSQMRQKYRENKVIFTNGVLYYCNA